MSLPKDMDEYTGEQLRAEETRRFKARQAGKCDYCGRPYNTQPACKFADRHAGKSS